jgi:hypothetical protein
MFLTQMYGTILGAFINYAIMISIVSGNKELLISGNGNSSWSGATMQAYNTNATSWALSSYLYKIGRQYELVPLGLLIGGGAVVVHRIFYQVFKSSPTDDTSSALPYTDITFSLFQKLADLTSPKSICLSSSNMRVTYPTINPKPV